MFCRKTANNLINKIHKQSLRVAYEIEDATFKDLSIKDSSWTIYENNIDPLLIEICKSLNPISAPIVPKNLLQFPKTSTSRYRRPIWYASTMF